MTPERWRNVERLYHDALTLDPAERAGFLQRACEADESLRADVESLLAQRAEAAAFMEAPAIEVMARSIAQEASLAAAPALPTSEAGGAHHLPVRASSGREAVEELQFSEDFAQSPSAADGEGGSTTVSILGFVARRPRWIWFLALPLAAAAAGLYFILLSGPEPAGWFLNATRGDGSTISYRVVGIQAGSAAERAGLETDDVLSNEDMERFLAHWRTHVGHRFEVVRAGRPQELFLGLRTKDWSYWRGSQGLRRIALMFNAALYLGLAAVLLFGRPGDRAARWGALLIAQLGLEMLLIASEAVLLRSVPENAQAFRDLPLPLGITVILGLSVSVMVPAGAFGFCAVFPRPLALPSYVWWLLGIAASGTILLHLDWFWLPIYSGAAAPRAPRALVNLVVLLGAAYLAWALILLARNYRSLEERNERRRLRIVAAGFGITLFGTALGILLVAPVFPLEQLRSQYWLGMPWQLLHATLFAAAPIATVYAITRHRVFDINVMVRLGLRYAAARGLILSIVPASAMVMALDVAIHREQSVSQIASVRGPFYLALAVGAFLLHARRKRWLDALDRRFFRERYNAHRLLSAVVDDVRRSHGFEQAASHAMARIERALHPEWASLMVRQPDERSFVRAASMNTVMPSIPAGARLLALARVLNRPLENQQSGTGWLRQQLPSREAEFLQRQRVEWLFPVSLGEPGTEAILLMGPKRSEEPYSGEDRELLAAVAASLGFLLERPVLPLPIQGGFGECGACGTCFDSTVATCPADGERVVRSPYSRTVAMRYRLDRILGRGGMGSVYEAFDFELERQVAVKVIRPEWIATPGALERFRREARAAASLCHPNIVTVYDFGASGDDRAYLVMQLLNGHSVRQELNERGSIEPPRVLEVMRGVSAAVALAHRQGLLHRDLKPENIFLEQSDRGEIPRVLDFGLVKQLTGGPTDTLPPGSLIGTLPYMSPEQLRGNAAAESWDIWALTVLAYEMLTGTHPFARTTDLRTLSHAGSTPISLSEASALPAKVRSFFGRSLAFDISDRPASVPRFIEELEQALSDVPDPEYQS
jgi:eukaryotic-like serine/threonine-protein kinase